MTRAERSSPPRLRRRHIGPYRLVRCLGQGAFARVYAAVRADDDAWVAVKVVLPGQHCPDSIRQRLLMEGHLAIGIDHPNVVRYLDVGEDDGAVYVVQELIDGGDLAALLAQHRQRVPATIIAAVGRDAAEGLHALHLHHLLHRDVKPANLLLTQDGRCKVADLGLVRPLDGRTGITANGMVVGTPSYVAPEQIRNDTAIDVRADIYSLGASLYWLATGQTPHQAGTLWGMLTRAVGEPFPDPRVLRPELPTALADIIMTAGSKDPARRQRDAAQLADACAGFLDGGTAARRRLADATCTPPRGCVPAEPGPLALLVGSDPLLVRLHAGRLLVDGWRVRIAADPAAVEAVAGREAPRAVIIDMDQADEGVRSLPQRLRSIPGIQGVPILGISRHASSATHVPGLTRLVDRDSTSPRALLLLLLRLLEQPGLPAPAGQAQPIAAILERLRPCLDGEPELAAGRLADLAASAQGLQVIATSANLGIAAAIATAVEILARQLGAGPHPQGARRTLERAVDALIATFTSPLPSPIWPARDVLVLEADPLVRRLVAIALRRVGLSIRATGSVGETLRLLADKPFSLVVIDARLVPSPGGFVAAVRQLAPVPVLLGMDHGERPGPGGPAGVERIDRPYTAGEVLAGVLTSLILAPAP